MHPWLTSGVLGAIGWVDAEHFAWEAETVTSHLSDMAAIENGSVDGTRTVHGVIMGLDGEHRSVPIAWEARPELAHLAPPDLSDSPSFHHEVRGADDGKRVGHGGDQGKLRVVVGGVPLPMQGDRLVGGEPLEDEDAFEPGEAPAPFTVVLHDFVSDLSAAATVGFARCAEQPRTAFDLRWPGLPYTGDPISGRIEGVYSPDGRHVAVLVAADPYFHMRAGTHASRGAVVLLPAGPEVQLLRPAGVGADALDGLVASLGPDFVVADRGTARKARERSVVYAAEGWDEHAAQLAAKLPGGAEVERLDWSVPSACLVVALGRSAEALWAN